MIIFTIRKKIKPKTKCRYDLITFSIKFDLYLIFLNNQRFFQHKFDAFFNLMLNKYNNNNKSIYLIFSSCVYSEALKKVSKFYE